VPVTPGGRNERRGVAGLAVRRQRIPVAGGNLPILVPQSLAPLWEAAARTAAPLQPYWAQLWPAAVGLARALMRGGSLAGAHVLDLGCGLGIAGVAAGLRGAAVTFADCDRRALDFARTNAAANGLTAIRFLELDWHTATAPGTYDLIILADVTYERRNHPPLVRHLERCLASSGRALVVDPFREAGTAFLVALPGHFACATTETDTHYEDRRVPLRIVEVRRLG
jgi:predicted nicotinamide N-methyase